MAEAQDARSLFSSLKEKAELAFAFIVMLCAVVGSYYVYWQLQVMRGQTTLLQQQTRVMQDQLADARRASVESDKVINRQLKLAESQSASLSILAQSNKRLLAIAHSQAESLRRQADLLDNQARSLGDEVAVMNTQAESLRTLATSNRTIAEAASKTAESSRSVANTSAQQLEITDRPWVRVSLSGVGAVQVLRPDPDMNLDRNGVIVPAGITLSNTGRSAANNLRMNLQLRFIGPSDEIWPSDADTAAAELCKTTTQSQPLAGTVLFPSDKVTLHRDAMREVPEEAIYAATPPWWRDSIRMDRTVQVLLVGCVTYTFGSVSVPHRTWFTYRLGKRVPPKLAAFQTWSFEIGKTIRSNDVLWEKLLYGGNGAD